MPGVVISGMPDGLVLPGGISPLVPPGDSPGIIGVLPGVLGMVDEGEYSVVVVSVVVVSLLDALSLLHAVSSIAALPMTASAALGPGFIRTLTFICARDVPGVGPLPNTHCGRAETARWDGFTPSCLGREQAMSVIATAKQQIVGVVENVVGKLADAGPHGAGQQTVTASCTVVEAEDLWRDAHRLSSILGEAGDVQFIAPDTYRWRLREGDHESTWESTLYAGPGRLRFADDSGNEIVVSYRPAPHHLGSEITLRAVLPVPGLLRGAAAFALLYRARALLQTGEVPTIAVNPSGR